MMFFLSALFLFTLGFVVLPFGTSWHEIPKVLLTFVLSPIFAVFFFWQEKNWRIVRMNRLFFLLCGGFVMLSLWGLVTAWTPTQFFGNIYRLQGIYLLWCLLLWSMVSPSLISREKIHLITRVSLILMLILALLGRTDPAGRAVSTIGEANSLGAYGLFLLPLTGTPLAFLPTLALIFLSGSRSAVLGLFASVIIQIGTKRFSHWIVVMTAVLFLAGSLLLPFGDTKQAFDYRADIWRTALQAGWERPILGWGVGNIELGLKESSEMVQTFLRYQYVDSSHNIFLDWWVQGGVVGFVLFSSLILLTLRGLVLKKETALLAAFFGLLAVMLFNPVSVAILVPFWWIIGVGNSKPGHRL